LTPNEFNSNSGKDTGVMTGRRISIKSTMESAQGQPVAISKNYSREMLFKIRKRRMIFKQ